MWWDCNSLVANADIQAPCPLFQKVCSVRITWSRVRGIWSSLNRRDFRWVFHTVVLGIVLLLIAVDCKLNCCIYVVIIIIVVVILLLLLFLFLSLLLVVPLHLRKNRWLNSQKVAIYIRGHDKPRHMGVAPSILSSWYIWKFPKIVGFPPKSSHI